MLMKKFFILAALLAMSTLVYSQNKPTKSTNVRVDKVDNKTFKAVKTNSSKESGYKATGYLYIDTDGNTYEIYSHVVTRGDNAGKTQYYIQRTSKKSGKTYWKRVEITL